MTGIYGAISKHKMDKNLDACVNLKDLGTCSSYDYLVDSEKLENAILCRCSINKFQNDKIFHKEGNTLVSTDGVVLNLIQLLKEYKTKNLHELILKLYIEYHYDFPRPFRGSFAGLIHFNDEQRLLLFTDQVGSRPLFYFACNGTLVFGSRLGTVVEMMRRIGYENRLDENGAYFLLTFGHMLGDSTIVRGVKRMPPGSILVFDKGDVSVRHYHCLSTKPTVRGTENDIIRGLYDRFRRAVYAGYSKDLEYGYRHIATLSGGLDSRNNVACAKQLGFTGITCLTFSQSNYLDHKIADRICRRHGFDHIFFPLDGGNYLVEYMDEVINILGGLAYYAGACGVYPWLRQLPLERYGQLHMGLCGGEILGLYTDHLSAKDHDKIRFFLSGKSTARLLTRISHQVDLELSKYEDRQLFLFHNMGVNGQMTAKQVYDQLIDTSSEHLFLDFLDFALRIPVDCKKNRKINAKMISRCFPEFAKYTWEHTRIPPKYPLHELRGYRTLVSAFNMTISHFSPYYSMNPVGYWYSKNSVLREAFGRVFRDNIDLLEPYPRLKNDCADVFENGNFEEKQTVITLLKSIKSLGLSA